MTKMKKRDLSRQSAIATWFTTRLFYLNGKPLKFSLKGCKESEFGRITKIVEAYGGELSGPTGDTIVFTEQDDPVEICGCYHLSFLRDCILANQLLDLERYKLPLDENRNKVKEESRKHVRFNEQLEGINIPKPKPHCNKSGESEKLNTKNPKKSGRCYSEEEDHKIMEYIIGKKLIARAASLHSWKEIAADNNVNRTPLALRNHFRNKLIHEYKQYTSDVGACKEFKKLVKKWGISSTNDDPSVHQKRCYIKWSDEENQLMMDYIVQNNLFDQMKSSAVSAEIIEKVALKNKRSIPSVQTQIHRLLRGKYQKYITDSQALRRIAAIRNKKYK